MIVIQDGGVLVPYKITLLSNGIDSDSIFTIVLVPYKITLLSNTINNQFDPSRVLVPYKITLLSNYCPLRTQKAKSFSTL